jgi:uncharacterized protein (DUF433 family)
MGNYSISDPAILSDMPVITGTRVPIARILSLIHAAANFASFFAFRGLSINESTFCRIVWK